MINPFNYKRRNSFIVQIGNTSIGGNNPIRIQSMTNVSTMDTEACVRQSVEIIDAGGEYVRLTTQGINEANNLRNIKDGLIFLGYQNPLIADIHFNRSAAEVSARIVEKVRINPGNFVDAVKKFKTDYTEIEYQEGRNKIKEMFIPFLEICRKNKTAIRVGVNHGSLSDRIMSRYGDTPEGMVESCMEFLRICKEEHFSNVVISIKASITSVMVRTVRLLADVMEKEDLNFPLHLGVTEAGEGEDGRIKSAIGIGALLVDGIGDTIRVSLSEDPANEIPVASFIRDYARNREGQPPLSERASSSYDPIYPQRRKSVRSLNVGRDFPPVVIVDYDPAIEFFENKNSLPDFVYNPQKRFESIPDGLKQIVDFSSFSSKKNEYPLFTIKEKETWISFNREADFIRLHYNDLDDELIRLLRKKEQTIILLNSSSQNKIGENRAFIHRMMNEELNNPIVLWEEYNESSSELFRLKSAIDAGSFFLDLLVDGLFLQNKNKTIPFSEIVFNSFGILQGSGRRITKTEYISCPGCGRTSFDLQTAVKQVKESTSHLKGLKIAVMGCIVNGPGEMADADYGYVGAGKGKINLYRGKDCLKKNIPEEKALEELLNLIKKDK